MPHTIAIIGAGFSGVATAVNLLREGTDQDLHIILVNRSGPLARGVAYGTNVPIHVLNVPAGRMGAFPDEENHFLRFLQTRDPSVTGGQFVARRSYGEYLEWLLREAQARHQQPDRLLQVVADVTDIRLQAHHGATITLQGGSFLDADAIVLAIGNYPPADPGVPNVGFFKSDRRYIRDPWGRDCLQNVDPDRPALLLGTGLTMYDVALDLQRRGHRSPLYAISRRGLLPLPHRSPALPPRDVTLPTELLNGRKTIRHFLRVVRRTTQLATDVDWRDILASIRAVTPALWSALPTSERLRFIRHLQPYWDVHRHRAAPEIFEAVRVLIASGRLVVTAGRLLRLNPSDHSIEAWIQRRGQLRSDQLEVGTVINCMGPNTNLDRIDEPLLASLRRQGLLVPDPLGIGVSIADNFGLIDASGNASNTLYYIGPFLKAKYWEATAVPELRAHARVLAKHLLELHKQNSAKVQRHMP